MLDERGVEKMRGLIVKLILRFLEVFPREFVQAIKSGEPPERALAIAISKYVASLGDIFGVGRQQLLDGAIASFAVDREEEHE